jgi:hypothetical protein
MKLINYIEPYMPFIARQYYRYAQGSGFAGQIVTSLSTAALLVGVWKPTLTYYGIPILPLIVVLAIAVPSVYFVIGQFLQYIGLYKYMQSFMNKEVNPEWDEFHKEWKGFWGAWKTFLTGWTMHSEQSNKDHDLLEKIAKKLEVE